MARTIAEIKQSMVDAKDAEASLSGLTSTSQTAVWNLLFFICAVAIKFIEDLFDVLQQDVEARRAEIPVGVLPWYASESLVYQFGDPLVFADGVLGYAVIDETKFVVDLAAADIVNGIVVIQLAKVVAGVGTPLSAPELSGVTDYWIEKRFAGTSITIVSANPDLLKAEYRITYDPQVLASDGSLLSDGAVFPVEDAINTFLQSFQILTGFAGSMRVMDLTDAIQSASGVTNAIANNIEGKPDGGSYTDVLLIANQTYSSFAGYIKIDPSFPLSGTLTYITT